MAPQNQENARLLGRSIISKDRKALRQAARISLVRDMRKGRLLIRFVCVDSKLRVRRGTLGIRRNFGHSSMAILKATGDILKKAATIRRCVQQPVLDKQLLRHIRKTITMICTDSASDEITAAEMMRGNVLNDMTILTPNLRVVLRDFAHSSRRPFLFIKHRYYYYVGQRRHQQKQRFWH